MLRRSFIKYSTLAASAAVFPRTALAASGAWETLEDMPFKAQEIYPCLYERGGQEFLFSGGGIAVRLGDPVVRRTALFDPRAGSWTEGVQLPEPRHHMSFVQLGTQIHAFGGFRRSGTNMWQMRRDHWVIDDPLNGSWVERDPMPGPRGEAVPVVGGGRLHLIGGRVPAAAANNDWEDHTDTALHWTYDAENGEWGTRAPLPVPRNSSAGCVLDGSIYIVSGRTVADRESAVCHRYDLQTDRWEQIAPLPSATHGGPPGGQGGLAAATVGGKIYAFGGEWLSGDLGVFADVWRYDPQADSWSAMKPMPEPRHGLGAVAIDGAIYVLGGAVGAGGSGVTATLARYTPA
ncbi:MAG: kelch repeat-containing protein [Pseudomonadota bacterium]